ncbi:structure-specific endonuclease subunit SLX4 [Nymphalis io]|uniref:structure-specific endonuclease subunit SLX4 n=1 Tax=Inachis io TaxID=171585 RepID=UPI002166D324|nr:structure-specific endonuclease subunit SLX4 [Nymphalis io]
MNIDNNSSECLSSCAVVSEYFSKETVMDNSLSDFQEKKKCKTGPKNIPKNKSIKQKKKLKKVKGQRDIRSLVKNKDSELVSYSKIFDQVCKKSGIDVDSEQLQLAITLSKSLHETELKTGSVSQDSKPLTLLGKAAKIRTTLQEYGFRVPNTKINQDTRKNKRSKKQYKLLLVSDEEKQQIISDRYAEVLATNIYRSSVKEKTSNSNNNQEIFYKASNICYEFLRNNDVFYVKELFTKPLCKSYLLRDWAEIPGRPASPKREVSSFNFENIECTQDDLDCILSGSLQTAQDIINSKYFKNNYCNMDTNDNDISSDKVDYIEKHSNNDLDDLKSTNSENVFKKLNRSESNVNEVLSVVQVRCLSPDIFDDEISLISDNDMKPFQIIQQSIKKIDNIDSMDLTECVNHVPGDSMYKNKHSLREINETKRKSNDLMEITECVPSDRQYPIENIDLTQSYVTEEKEANKFEDHLVMNLKQSNSDDDLSSIKVIGKKDDSIDSTIIINECFEVIPNLVTNKDRLSSKITSKADSIESYELKNNLSQKITIDNAPNRSLTNSSTENEDNFSKCCHNNSAKLHDLEIDLTQSVHSYHDFQLSQNVGTKKVSSIDKTIDIIEDAEFNSKPVCSIVVTIQEDPVNKDDHNKSKDSIKNQSVSGCFGYKKNNKLFSEFYGPLYLNKENDNFKTYEEIDLTQPLNFVNEQVAKEKKISIDNTVPIVDDIESNESPMVNEEILQLQSDSEIIHNECNMSPEKNVSGSNDNNINYSLNEYVHNNSYIYDFYDENSLPKDETQEKTPIENTSSDKCIHDKSQSYSQHPNHNACASTSYSHKNLINNTDKVFEDEVDNIDLTQKSDSSNEVVSQYHPKTYDPNSLGKINNISIDYDEMFDDVISTERKYVSQASNNTADNSNNELSNPSKTSDGFEISDKEFNYSLQQSRHNFDIGGLSIMDNVSDLKLQSINKSNNSGAKLNRSHSDSDLPSIHVNKVISCTPKQVKSNNFASQICTTVINECLIKEVQKTPSNSEFIIKTNDVTPMLDYESMSSPERNRELEKYGLKPFKRKRAIQLLKHLYNQTHPVVESCEVEECSSPSKKRKYDIGTKQYISPEKSKKSPRKQLSASFEEIHKENTLYAMTKEIPDLREIKCVPDEWVFQKREKAKMHSCKVPLHIAFHNYVSCRQLLREAILRYEPVNIDVIHKDLVAYGYKYNPKDLLRFMDKKCITVKTADNNSKNRKL